MSEEHTTERLSRIEQGIATLTADVSALVKISTQHGAQISELQSLDRDRRNTPWTTLIALAALLVTIGALALDPVRTHMNDLSERFDKHADLDGHTQALIMHTEHRGFIDRLRDDNSRLSHRIDDIEHRVRDIESTRYTPNDRRSEIVEELLGKLVGENGAGR